MSRLHFGRQTPLLAGVLVLGGVLLTLFVVSSSATPTPPCTTLAVLTGSTFEIDTSANLAVDGSTANCSDWLTGNGSSAKDADVNINPDKPSGTGDDAFGQGTSENDANPTIVSGSIPPNKSDLKSFGVHRETTSQGKFLQLFWARVQNPSGTTNMDFELNQKFCDTTATPTNCANNGKGVTPETPVRTSGDKLITYDLSKGGTVPTISIRTWDGTQWGAATTISGGSGSCASDGTGHCAIGSVNTSALASTETGSDTGLGALDAYTFGEASIDFKAIFGGNTCGTFGGVYLKSRSSDSFTSEIKDFVSPEKVFISNCSSIATNATASATYGAGISDTATLSNVSSTATGNVTFKLYGPFTSEATTPTTDACTDPGTGVTGNLITTITKSLATDGSYDSATEKWTISSGSYAPSTPLAVGRYQWVASYAGDGNNTVANGACNDANEASIVSKVPTSVSTSATASVTYGSGISDSATITGATSAATGNVVFKLYGPFDASTAASGDVCTDPASGVTGNLVTTITKPITDGTFAAGPPRTWTVSSGSYAPSTPLAVGRYQWVVSYAGDSTNAASSGSCRDAGEASIVGKASSSLSTTQRYYPNDTATVTGSAGDVTFSLYGPYATGVTPTCALADRVFTQTVSQSTGTASTNNGPGVGANAPVTAAGTYAWVVSVAPTATHDGRSSGCGAERFTLTVTNDGGPGTP